MNQKQELGHCEHMFYFHEGDPEKGIARGEPYCHRCPGIPLIGNHCCLAGCSELEERKIEGKRRIAEMLNDEG